MYFEGKIETRKTAELRSKFRHERKFLSKFYKTNRAKVPTTTDVVLDIILLFAGLLILSIYGSTLTGLVCVLTGCSILILVFKISGYLKSKHR